VSGAVISGARKPIGKLGSSLSRLPAVNLGALVIGEASQAALAALKPAFAPTGTIMAGRAIADALGRRRLALADLEGSVTLSFFGQCTDPVKGGS
jgi:hypothetical protein